MNVMNAMNARKRKFEQFIDEIKSEKIKFEPLSFEQIEKLKKADINKVGESLKRCKTVLIGTKIKLAPSYIIEGIRKDLKKIKTIFYEKAADADISPTQVAELTELSASYVYASSKVPALPTPDQITDRKKIHLQMLLHATSCCDSSCHINCKNMKDLLAHNDTCYIDNCKYCISIKNMLKMHSDLCVLDKCSVKGCHRRNT
jgi:hypothetical protein